MNILSRALHYRKHFRNLPLNRITFMMSLGFAMIFVIFLRLFYLQVVQGSYYAEVAFEKNQGYSEIPARRGEILIKDRHSGEPYALATNTTLDLVYADPTLIENSSTIVEKLAPLLFDLETEREHDEQRYKELLSTLRQNTSQETNETTPNTEPQSQNSTTPPIPTSSDNRLHTDEELYILYKQELTDTLNQKTRNTILIGEALASDIAEKIRSENLSGIEVNENNDLYAYPLQITDQEKTAKSLAKALDIDRKRLEKILIGKNRYVILKRKLAPEISKKIEELIETERKTFVGIRLKEEYFRFYPESELAAQILGYIDHRGIGQYGIEGRFDNELSGENGYFTSQIDGGGQQITVGDSKIVEAINGANIMLTIDRAIQIEAEKILAKGVKDAKAENGVLIVQESKTGKILAMAHTPSFDPNTYGDVFKLEEIELNENQIANLHRVGEGDNEKLYLYLRKDPDERIQIFHDKEKNKYYKFANNIGPEVYQLRAITLPYEPGSVFKTIAMASGVDAEEVTPSTTFFSGGPVKVDEYEIHTFNDEYYGLSTMTEVLIHSDNTGMVFVARKLGRALFYSYLKAFGFGEKTGIEFESENSGRLAYYETWAESELVTKGFGQGISITPIQLATAISAIANGGLLMQPYIVESMEESNGKKIEFEPKIIRRTLTEKTSDQVTAMMTAVIEKGAKRAALEDHYIAGKSGTAQTYKYGKVLKGIGTTITSYVGFGPINDPEFTILVKLDRPKTVEWAESTAGPIFKEMAEFLFQYFNIPPDKGK